jgi:hypothetical protein
MHYYRHFVSWGRQTAEKRRWHARESLAAGEIAGEGELAPAAEVEALAAEEPATEAAAVGPSAQLGVVSAGLGRGGKEISDTQCQRFAEDAPGEHRGRRPERNIKTQGRRMRSTQIT